MTKKHQTDDFKNILFRDLIKGIKPIKNDRIDLFAHPENVNPFKDNHNYSENNTRPIISDQFETQVVGGEEFIFFSHTGLQLKTQKQLRQGKVPIDDHLDLHGLSMNEARDILLEFIDFAQQQQIRCVLLVHGKGYRANSEQPVLKNMINSWLRQHPGILAFSSAQARDGGTGAVYILIKTL